METLEKKVMTVIRSRAGTLGLTQSDLAQKMGVSLVTMKRWYKGQGLKISHLEKLCLELGLELSKVFEMAQETKIKTFFYSQPQEEALAIDPRLLALFDLLLGGATPAMIKKKYKMEEKVLTSLLLKLDKLKLIELGANNKVKILSMGEPIWRPDGPLTKRFRKQMIEDFLGEHKKSSTTFFIHDYLPQDALEIRKKIEELENYMLASNTKAGLRPEEGQSYGAYIKFENYEWSLRSVLY